MHLVDGQYQCMRCGTIVDVPFDTTPEFVYVVESRQRTVRSIRVDGVEVHRCAASDAS